MALDEIRKEIDAVDTAVKPLFLKRMECAAKVAAEKAKTGGDVFVLERELAIIDKRASDVKDVHDEYVMFLRVLMSISRRYQYGILKGMQDQVIADALAQAGLTEAAKAPHRFVEIAFTQKQATSDLNLFLNMTKLNDILVDALLVETKDGVQEIKMKLCGNVQEAHMRQLLCQIGKEAEAFRITALS